MKEPCPEFNGHGSFCWGRDRRHSILFRNNGKTRTNVTFVPVGRSKQQTGGIMLEVMAVVLLILWILGLVSAHTMGGFIHLLLILAVIVVGVRFFQKKRA